MRLLFKAVDEERPGRRWRGLFDATWASYRGWFLSEGNQARPSYRVSRRALQEHMPELVATYDRLVELAGGGDLAARFLSLWCPARYLGACSQASIRGPEPALVRNYDYSPPLCEAALLRTAWTGRRVIAMSDCLWGALDGINDAGLAVSLAFGGRQVVGEGFGIPLVLRYVLETCDSAPEASRVLERVPVHMTYSVTVVDAYGQSLTVYVAPDRPALITDARVATNHQAQVEWPEHAAATRSLEREVHLTACLESLGSDPSLAVEALATELLRPPLYLSSWAEGWGTLYTAIYRPRSRSAEYRWPTLPPWIAGFDRFPSGERVVAYGTPG